MRHGDYLFRRNGRFYARIRVPNKLHVVLQRTEIRTTLNTSDYSTARLRVLEVVLNWKRDFEKRLNMLDIHKTVSGSPMLLGEGLIPVIQAANEMGLAAPSLLQECANRKVELRFIADALEAVCIPVDELERDFDGSLLIDSALDMRQKVFITGELLFSNLTWAVNKLITSGSLSDCLFFRDHFRKQAVVTDLPENTVELSSVLILKRDAEILRIAIAATITSSMLEVARSVVISKDVPTKKHKYADMRVSAVLKGFLAEKDTWAKSTYIQMKSMCSLFVEAMGDPILNDIDGPMLLDYKKKLLTLPINIHRVKQKYKIEKFVELNKIAKQENLPLFTKIRADAYIIKLSEMFGWAEISGYLPRNPAVGIVKKSKRMQRDQDEREIFSDAELQKIFTAEWFALGCGDKGVNGTYNRFQPHYYWLPLLALYSGGRLNELSQLYLKDIQCSSDDVWYMDFNLDGSIKIDELDKRLKTVNSIRIVPLHTELVRLGFIDYVMALKKAGYDRIFPELRFDRVKGYGKQAGQWFNERFLGKKLNIVRDGKKTFHSFRHGFITNLFANKLPEQIVNQISGHERGESLSANRYRKDEVAINLKVHIDQIKFNLPRIAAFDVQEGMAALKYALSRKEK